jgi:hypothetical protein
MVDDELQQAFIDLADRLRKAGNTSYRRYELKIADGRLVLARDEICRAVENAIAEVCGTEVEPDDNDGIFLD